MNLEELDLLSQAAPGNVRIDLTIHKRKLNLGQPQRQILLENSSPEGSADRNISNDETLPAQFDDKPKHWRRTLTRWN
jgi:hypothetical protein